MMKLEDAVTASDLENMMFEAKSLFEAEQIMREVKVRRAENRLTPKQAQDLRQIFRRVSVNLGER